MRGMPRWFIITPVEIQNVITLTRILNIDAMQNVIGRMKKGTTLSPLYDNIRKAYHEYLIYLKTNPRVRIPEHIHDPELSIGRVHASSLGRCPLASAKKREVEIQEDMSTLHLMQQGIRDAEPLQEAMFWKYQAAVELSIEKPPFRGRLDILHKNHVIEIKRRDGWRKDVPPEPRLTDVYQMIAYHFMTRYRSINLCLMTRFDFFFWKLEPQENGFKLYDENREAWKNPYNQPNYLNYNIILSEAKEHLEYLNQKKDSDPMEGLNMFDLPMSNECGHWSGKDRPKRYKTEYNGELERTAKFIPHCPFWKECKHIPIAEDGTVEVQEVAYASKEYRIIETGANGDHSPAPERDSVPL